MTPWAHLRRTAGEASVVGTPMTGVPMSSSLPGGEPPRARATSSPSDDARLIVPPDDWHTSPTGNPLPDATSTASTAPTTGSDGSGAAATPSLDGLSFTRGTEQNSRAVIGIVLSGLAGASILAFVAGLNSPLLITVALGLAGAVMGWRGYLAARNGLASNGGLGLTAVVVGGVAILSVVGIYATVLIALSRVIP